MKLTVSQIAAIIGAEIEGEAELEIDQISKIEEGKPGSITFLANPKYASFIYDTQASAVIVAKNFEPHKAVSPTLLRVDDPYASFTHLLEKVSERFNAHPTPCIEQPSFIAESAKIGKGVFIGAFSYIGAEAVIGDHAVIYPQSFIGEKAEVGEGSVLYPQTTISSRCKVGRNCILHTGARLGSDGFGFAPQNDGSYRKIPQLGVVVLEDEVELGANTCIDRATMGATIIKKGVKLDNLIQIGHNVEIGDHTVIAAQTGIAGSTKLGKNCLIGGQVGFVGHLKIADQTNVEAQTGMIRSVKETGTAWRGSPAQPYRQQLKSEVLFRQLEKMEKRIRSLEATLKKESEKDQA